MVAIHSVQSRSDIAHQGHEEEWDLEDGMLKKVKPIYDAFIPMRIVHIDKE